ncbi:MAG: protein translocase subunit SecF, partial [Bacteroidetes bacterium]
GFAVSLMIGIITSLIAALVITRLILDYYANRGNNSLTFGFNWSTTLFDNIKVKMASRKRAFYIFSGTLTVLSFISFAVFGFKTGVDFDGGRQFVVEFRNADGQPAPLSGAEVNTIRTDLTAAFEGNAPVIKTLRSDNQIMVTTSYLVNDREATTRVTELLSSGLNKNFKQYTHKVLSTFDVGPTVASDIRNAAFLSVFFSLIIIFLYILLRFRKWQFSLGGVLAIFHDVIITLGVFSFLRQIPGLPFSVEIDQSIIAALLTIIGYSINDTVVVFDRVRENINEMKTSNLPEIFTVSIDQTFSRTIITSGATILSALVLFIFAGDVIRGFVFAILVGIGFGTYSSIFVASALALDFMTWGKKDKQEETAETPVKA